MKKINNEVLVLIKTMLEKNRFLPSIIYSGENILEVLSSREKFDLFSEDNIGEGKWLGDDIFEAKQKLEDLGFILEKYYNTNTYMLDGLEGQICINFKDCEDNVVCDYTYYSCSGGEIESDFYLAKKIEVINYKFEKI